MVEAAQKEPEKSAEAEDFEPLPPGFVLDPAPGEEPARVQAPLLTRRTGGVITRGGLEAAGGAAGSVFGAGGGFVAGLPTGPGATITALGGGIAGGVLGSAGGAALFDSANDILAAIEGDPDETIGLIGQLNNLSRAATTDLLFNMGGSVLQPARAFRALRAKISGVTSRTAMELQELGARFGIGLGAVDVGGTFPRGFSRALGVFPWVGTPLRKAETVKIREAGKAVARTLDAFGPNERLASQVGIDMFEAAKATRQEFRNTAGALYNTVEDAIEAAARQDIIPTEAIKDFVADALRATKAGDITIATRAGELVPTGVLDQFGNVIFKQSDGAEVLLPRAARQEVIDMLEGWSKLPENITPQQYRRLTEDIKDMMAKRIKDGFDIKELSELKAALRSDFDNIRTDLLPAEQAESIQSALRAANRFYAKGIIQFRTKAAQSLERADRFIFRAGAETPGSLNPDEIMEVAVNLRSPQQIADLTKLVGKRNMKAAASIHFERASTLATEEVRLMGTTYTVTDPSKLERGLGLVGAGIRKIEGLEALYKTAGVSLEAVRGLIRVMKNIEGIGNPAEFVRRRAILGGAGAIAGAIGFGAITDRPGETGAITAFAMVILGRHAAKVFARPERLRLMTTALDEAARVSVRRGVLARLVKVLVEEDDGQGPIEVPVFPETAGLARQ